MDGYDEDYQNQNEQQEEDENYNQSAVRQQIAKFPAHQSFDVSSFAESRNGVDVLPKHRKGGFPISNAPTLQVSPQPKLNFLPNHKNLRPDQFKIQTDLSISKSSNIQQQLQNFKKQLRERDNRQDGYIQKIQQLNNTNLDLEKIIRQKDAIIKQKQQLLLLQQRKYKQSIQNSAKSVSFSNQQKYQSQSTAYIDQFCPQLLSPQQSLQLFTQLLSKVYKSTSMKKKIVQDRQILGMLSQLIKR